MGGKGREVLRVLGAVLGADGDAHDHRHGQQPGGHRLPLRQLVEQLVAGPAHEVGVHQLGDHPAAFHAVTDGRADDGGLGDGRVEQPVIGQGLRQPAVHGERAAPIAVLLAERDHGRVDGEAVQHRLEDGVADVEHLHLGHRLAILEGGAHLAPDLLDPGVLGAGPAAARAARSSNLSTWPVGEHDAADQFRVDRHAGTGFQVGGQPEHGEHDLLDLALRLRPGPRRFDRAGIDQPLRGRRWIESAACQCSTSSLRCGSSRHRTANAR